MLMADTSEKSKRAAVVHQTAAPEIRTDSEESIVNPSPY
jgi:hypothetical protein